MHQIAARNAIRPVLAQLFPELADTIERHAKIENLVWAITKSIHDSGLRFVDTSDHESRSALFNYADVAAPSESSGAQRNHLNSN